MPVCILCIDIDTCIYIHVYMYIYIYIYTATLHQHHATATHVGVTAASCSPGCDRQDATEDFYALHRHITVEHCL